MEQEAPGTWAYAAALVVTILCLALANVVIAYLGELAGVEAGTSAASALAFAQGVAGALLAGLASWQLFRSVLPANFWLKWIVGIAAALFAAAILYLVVLGKSDRAFSAATLAGLTALGGTEVGRRIAKTRFPLIGSRSPS